MSNKTVKLVLDAISKDYHEFLEKANLLASNSLLDKNVEFKFYERRLEESIDFDRPKISTGKISGVTVTSDGDILFDVIETSTSDTHILFSRDILNVEG
jgi:hypothetical protein